NPLDLYYMPYTHSLVGALLWSLGAYVAYRLIRRFGASHRAALLVAVAVFSHWVLDLVVHRPDLPLYDDTLKVGLGLWNHRPVAAQQIPLSQRGGVTQMVGGTRIEIRYSRPVARRRELFGKLVPWGKVWCPGADTATTIAFSAPVHISGKPLDAGTYSLWAI